MGYITKGDCEGNKSPKIKLGTCLIFGLIFLMMTVVTLILEPVSITSRYMARVDNGSLTHQALEREADSVHLSVYLFNITNAEQFANGEDEKLKVQEVGPFTYQENRTNEDLEIDHEAGVVRYTIRHKVTFLPEESMGDPKNVILTLPNVAMLAMASEVTNYGYFAKMGFNMLARRLDSNATVTMNAHDYMWGYEEPLIRLGNQIMPGWITYDKLGLLDRLYDNKTSLRLEVSSKDSDKFMVKTANSVAGLKQWGYEDLKTRSRCNSFTDVYEGLCYPPDMTPSRRIRLYRNVLCRFLDLDYQGITITDVGFEGLLYKISNRTYKTIPDNQCLCSNGICHEGISDISRCMNGLPIVLSNAHFMDTDPKIYERIEGLTPNEKEHGSEFVIEKMVGIVMKTKFSVQVNIMMRDVGFNSKVNKFSDMVVPVGYFKIVQPKLTAENLLSLRLMYIYGPYFLLSTQILFTAAGLLLISHSLKLLYYNWIYGKRRGLLLNVKAKDTKEASVEPLMR